MDAVESALLSAGITVALAGAVGYGLYRIINVPNPQTPLDWGRKWLSYSLFLTCISALSSFFWHLDANSFAVWVLVSVVLGTLCFFIGWAYGKLRNIQIKKSTRLRGSTESRLFEEEIYAQVAEELAQGKRKDSLWAKALAESDGIENKAKSLYIKYRVQSIKDEIEVSEKNEKQRQEAKKATQQKKEIQAANKADSMTVANWFWLFLIFGFLIYMFYIFDGDSNSLSTASHHASPQPSPALANTVVYQPPALSKPSAELTPQIQQNFNNDYNLTIEVQRLLQRLGFDPGPVDGVFGSQTRQAIIAAEKRLGLYQQGDVTQQLRNNLASEVAKLEQNYSRSHYDRPRINSSCQFKAVMTDQDYINCGANPPPSY